MAEIGLADPGRHDQAVVGNFEGLDADDAGVHDPAVKVEPGDLGQFDEDVLVLAEHVANGRRDLAGGSIPVATWYSSGWKRWWFLRSSNVTSTLLRARRRAAGRPPKPPPTITTR